MTELTTTNCKNCNQPVEKNFCENCGQKKIEGKNYGKKKPKSFFGATVFNLDKGMWYTIKMMFVDPKKVINDYVGGNTIKYMHPFRVCDHTAYNSDIPNDKFWNN